jgi:hypothetical protein
MVTIAHSFVADQSCNECRCFEGMSPTKLCRVITRPPNCTAFLQYSLLSPETSSPHDLAAAQQYYSSVEFAFQLCREFAAVEASDRELSAALGNACETLERIVAHNALLKCLDCQPTWSRHAALLRFDLPLHRLTTHYVVSKKWFPRFFSLRGSRLYYSDGKNGHPDTAEGTLAFMQLNPAPDGRYCVDVQGMRAAVASASLCNAASQAALWVRATRRSTGRRSRLTLSSLRATRCRPDAPCHVVSAVTDLLCLQAPRDVCLAAADDVTRQRCVRVIQAASAGDDSSSLHHIASAVALTGELLKMKSLPALNAVMAALGKAEVGGLDLPSLKAAGLDAAACRAAGYDVPSLKAAGFTLSDFRAARFDPKSLWHENIVHVHYNLSWKCAASLRSAGYDVLSLIAVFGYDAVASSGCDVSSILVTSPPS